MQRDHQTNGEKKKEDEEQGKIEVVIGPMFSGKTTELIRRMRRYVAAQKRCIIVKYIKDTRYSNGNAISTHDSTQFDAITTGNLNSIASTLINYDVIGIDEGQFFENLSTFCDNLANSGKTIVVAGLDGTFQRKPFMEIILLIPKAEEVVKLTAICMRCMKHEASFSFRTSVETEEEVIGGKDKYMAVCRDCYLKLNH